MEKAKDQVFKIEITWRTIIFTAVFIILLQVLWALQDLLMSLFIAFIIMSVAKPLVARLERIRIPRTLSALVLFILLFWGIGWGVAWLLPLLASDMTAFARSLNTLISDLDPAILQYFNGKSFNEYLPNVTTQIFPFLRNIFSNVVFVMTTLFFSFYFIVEENFIRNFLMKFFKKEQAERVALIFDKTERRMGTWFRGELVLMVVIGVVTYIGLLVIGVRHALSLAVIAGLLEVFPVIGPIISAVPAFIFAVNQSYFLGISTLALYTIIQQLENNLIVPWVMKQAIGLNKILILIVLIAGGKLAGVLGLFIAIPLTITIQSVLMEAVKPK